jgi:hypothetical protein
MPLGVKDDIGGKFVGRSGVMCGVESAIIKYCVDCGSLQPLGCTLYTVHCLFPIPILIPMAPQTSPSGDDASSDLEEMDFDQALQDFERSLLLLKARYAQVQSDQEIQQSLKQELTQVQRQVLQSRSQKRRIELKRELKQLKEKLEETELALESQLFSWSGLREVFWQMVRFGGFGIIIGWVLRGWAG